MRKIPIDKFKVWAWILYEVQALSHNIHPENPRNCKATLTISHTF